MIEIKGFLNELYHDENVNNCFKESIIDKQIAYTEKELVLREKELFRLKAIKKHIIKGV